MIAYVLIVTAYRNGRAVLLLVAIISSLICQYFSKVPLELHNMLELLQESLAIFWLSLPAKDGRRITAIQRDKEILTGKKSTGLLEINPIFRESMIILR